MRKLLSLVLVAAMLLSMVAAIPMNAGAADDGKLSTQAEAYYFGGETKFNELYGAGTTAKPYQYYGEEPVPFDEKKVSSDKVLTIDGVIDEGEWGNPSFTVSSDYAANNGGFTSRANDIFEEPSAENSYFYYNKDSYKYANQYVKTPIEEGMSYTVYLMWDEDYLYVAADVYDITGHSNSNIDTNIWNGDAFQFRVDKDGSYTRADGYNADGGKDADGNHITNYPWRSSQYRGGTEFTTGVPNFIVCYTSGNGGTTITRDNANRYYAHDVLVDDPDSEVETDMITETQYCDIDISYAIIFEDVCETYDDYKASNFGGQPTAVAEWGPAYAVAKPVKQSGTKYQTQYEIAIPWEYIDDASDFLAEAGDEFGFATMLLDRQTGLSTSFGAFLEWGNGINSHRAYHDHKTCNGSNSLLLSATSFDARADYHEHTYSEATCAQPETCTVCGYQRGFKTGHDYEITSYKLPTPDSDGYVTAKCLNETCVDPYAERTLNAASEEVYKWVDRNDGVVDLSSRLSSAFNAAWTNITWTYATAEGASEPSWTPTAGTVVYNTNGDNAGSAKNMLWLKGQTRPEVISNEQTEVSAIVNPYDFTVLDLTCMSETGTYFHMYDFKGKNSAVSVDVNIWNRLTQAEREMEGETGYNDTLVFWFGPTLIEYAAGLYIIEDKDEAGVVTDTNYYFAITPSGLNGSSLTIAEFEDRALAYKEIDPSVVGIGEDEWHNMTFFIDYDANAALLFWDGELAVGEYDYHFAREASTADPILRVFNLELCLTDLRAGEAGLAAKYVNVGGEGGEDTEPTPDTTEPEPDTTEPEPDTTEPEPEPALGSYENPYLLNLGEDRLAVTVKPQESAYVKVSDINNTVVTAGYATSASYMLNYLRFTYLPEGEDNSTSFTMIPDAGMDVFSVYNTSETEDVVVYLTLAAGDPIDEPNGPDNPEVIEFAPNWFGNLAASATTDLAAGNQGYWYKLIAPADGFIDVSVGANDAEWNTLGWTFCVNNLTTGVYGDYITFDPTSDEWIDPTIIEVSEGDELQIFAVTYDPADMWNAPAGTINVNAGFGKLYDSAYPGPAELGENTAVIEEGSQGWYYKWVVTEKGTVTITMNSADGWMYSVSKTPADIEDYSNYYYGDTHWSDDETVVASESIEVEAGDVVTIMVNTYDPANAWTAPAGSVNWTLSFEEYKEPEFDGEGLLYTLSGEIVDGQLIAKLDLSDNDEGILLAILDLVYNTDALKFVSADTANSVFTNPDMSLMNEGRIMIYGEGDLNNIANSYENGEVVTLVFDILDPTANFDFDLVARDGDEANHANVDADGEPAVVKFTFTTAEDMPENGVLPEPEDFTLGVTGADVDGQLHVTVDLSGNPGIWSLGFALEYNAAALEFAGVLDGDVFAAGDALVSDAEGVVTFFASNDALENITADGTLVTLVFNVVDYDADYGIDVTYDAGNVINVDGEEVDLTVAIGEIAKVEPPVISTVTVTVDGVATEYEVGATVTLAAAEMFKADGKYYVFKNWTAEGVELSDATAKELTFVVPANDVVITSEGYLHGDVNNDGKVNALDSVLMIKVNKKIESAEGRNADVNLDGKISALDTIAMKKVIKKNYDYEKNHEVVEK